MSLRRLLAMFGLDCITLEVTKEDCKRALTVCLQNELSCLPEAGYVGHLRSSGLVMFRFSAING